MSINKYSIYFLSGLFIISLFFSCSKDKYILSKEKMTEVLYDIELAQALSQTKHQNYSSADAKDALFDGILIKHDITKEILDSSLVWYSDNIDLYREVKDSVAALIVKQQDIYAKLLEQENRRNGLIGGFSPYFYITPGNSVFRFNFDSLNVNTLKLTPHSDIEFKVLGLSQDIRIKMFVYMQYSDTSVINTDYITTDSSTINLNFMKDRKLKNFSGYFRVDSVDTPYYNVLVYDFKLDNDSVKVEKQIKTETLKDTPLEFKKIESVSRDR